MTTTLKSAHSPCVSRILPALAVLTLALTGGNALASVAGRAAINAKLTPANIPTLNVGVIYDAATAKQPDLLLALALALEDPANSGLTAAEIAEGALEPSASLKTRSDKDKVAGQIIATAISSRNLASNAAQLASVTAAVFNVNGANLNTKLRLTDAGKAIAFAAAIKSTGTDSAGNDIGKAVATVYSGDLATLLTNTTKALGTSSAAASGALQNAVDGLFDQGAVVAGNRQAFTRLVAEKIAATNPSAAGSLYGGLVLNNPNSQYTGDTGLQTLAQDFLSDAKLAKAYGEILATTMGAHTNKASLANTLTNLAPAQKLPTKSLIVQGILRAGTSTDVSGIINAVIGGVADRAGFAGIVSVGNGGDATKLDAIVKKISDNQDVTAKTKIGAAVIGAIGTPTPSAANTATKAIFDSAGGGFTDDASRTKFGTDNVAKVKSFAAAGYMASAIAERNIADSANKANDAADIAVALMAKGSKAATDIAQQISALSTITDRAAFAELISDKNKKFVQNAAVGISITDPTNSETITYRAITHDVTLVGTKLVGDVAALANAPVIAGAVASAVDEEKAADIGATLANAMSNNGTTAGKPIKLSTAATLATALSKAIQNKPGVKTTNRMDELGEVTAAIVSGILGKNGSDTAGLKKESSLITAVGNAVLKTLSEIPVNETRTALADQSEARDIAGSIAQTIFAASNTLVPAAQKNTLLGVLNGGTHTQGALEKAFLKLAGKKNTTDYNNVIQAFQDVLTGAGAAKFETGSVNDKETDTKNG